MSSIVVSGDTSGAVTLAVPAVAGTNTVTIAAQTGTLNAAGPAFSAYQSTQQTISSGTQTKLQFQTEEFDTNNNFDSTTNYRFTPTVAGYYQVSGAMTIAGAVGVCDVQLWKNGSIFKYGNQTSMSTGYTVTGISTLVYLNGSSDYIELYGIQYSGINQSLYNTTPAAVNYFQAVLVRGA